MQTRGFRRLIGAALVLVGCSGSHTQLDEHGKDAGKKAAHGNSHDAAIDARTDGDGSDMKDSGAPSSARDDASMSEQHPVEDAGDHVEQPDACVSGACADAGASRCENHPLKSNAHFATHAANVLFVFDRSGSMAEDWNGAPRWEAAGNAVHDALTPLADDFTAGAVFFPSTDPDGCADPTGVSCMIVPGVASCAVNPITESDQIAFTSGSDFLRKFTDAGGGSLIYAPIASGLTPLVEALHEAKTALETSTLTGTITVVIITDGQPNCAWDAAMAHTIVGDWHTAGMDISVIGLPGTGTDMAALDDLADAAGTTESDVTNSTDLEPAIQDVLSDARRPVLDSCTIDLDAPAAKAAELHVIVTRDGDQYAAGSADWSLAGDRSSITLKGDLCKAAKNGELTALKIVDGCVDRPALSL